MARSIFLFWIDEGLEPLTSLKNHDIERFDYERCKTLRDAVSKAIAGKNPQKLCKKQPWIRAGSGHGAAALNWQAILLLRDTYNEGVKGGVGSELPDYSPPI